MRAHRAMTQSPRIHTNDWYVISEPQYSFERKFASSRLPGPRAGLKCSIAAGNKNAAIHRVDAGLAAERHAQVQFLVNDLKRLGHARFTHGA